MKPYIMNRIELKNNAKSKINIKAAFAVVLIIYFIPSLISNFGLFSNFETVQMDGMIYTVQVPNAIGMLFAMVIPFLLEYWSTAYFMYAYKEEGEAMSSMEFFSSLKFNAFLKYIMKLVVSNILVFLWSLLFVIPGIIKAYSYYLVPFIAAERPELGIFETIKESKRLMNGAKAQTVILDLSFLGWSIVSSMTFGIVGFWLMPYYSFTRIGLYHDLVQRDKMDADIIDADIA